MKIYLDTTVNPTIKIYDSDEHAEGKLIPFLKPHIVIMQGDIVIEEIGHKNSLMLPIIIYEIGRASCRERV